MKQWSKEAGEEGCQVKSQWFTFLAPKPSLFSFLLFVLRFLFGCLVGLGFWGAGFVWFLWVLNFFYCCFLLFSNN